MPNFSLIILTISALVLPAVMLSFLLRRWLPQWRSCRWLRGGVWGLSGCGIFCLALIAAAPHLGVDPASTPLGLLVLVVFLAQIAALVVLPLSVLVMRRQGPDTPNDTANDHLASPRRRLFLQSAAASLPLAAVGTSLAGVVGTARPARVRLQVLPFAQLPVGLAGLRILHLTDLHLGGFMTLEKLTGIVAAAKPLQPHLIVVTGDMADDLRLLPAALAMIAGLDPELGVYVTLGNHEYGCGVTEVRRLVAASPVRLLFNEKVDLAWRGVKFHLAGIDDSAGGLFRRQRLSYVAESVTAALRDVEPNVFTILLSHRPEAFDFAAAGGVDLTFAGHTHGGQLGFAGWSVLSLTGRFRYPRGLYRLGQSQLYTSSGAGQWVPFRLGCPAEAPVFELSAVATTKETAMGSCISAPSNLC